MIALARWTFAALGALFLGIQPKPTCNVCGERCRDIDAHLWFDHADDGSGVGTR